jgi:hypothetical protein
MLLSRHQNAGQNHDIRIGNRWFENVAQFKYLGMTITNENLIQEGIKRRLNSGNACYLSVQNHLSSRLLSKNIGIRIYKTIILPVVLYGYETFLKLREENILRAFQNRLLWRIFGPKRDEVTGDWRKLNNEELYNSCSFSKCNYSDPVKKDEMGGACSTNGKKSSPVFQLLFCCNSHC